MGERFYTRGGYLRENPTWHAEDAPWKAAQIMRILRGNSISPSSVVEVGCGSGEILNQLRGLMPSTEFVGYDISPQAIEMARPKERPRLQFRLGDPAKEAHRWDVLLCIDVVEHVEDYFGFLRGISSKARHKVFHIPLELSAQAVLRRSRLSDGRTRMGHSHYFTRERLRS